jgi:hypothetical protein
MEVAGETYTSELCILGRCRRDQVSLVGLPIRFLSWRKHKLSHMGIMKNALAILELLIQPPNAHIQGRTRLTQKPAVIECEKVVAINAPYRLYTYSLNPLDAKTKRIQKTLC